MEKSTKKRVIVYLGSFYPYEDAITNVLLPFLEALQSQYEVDLYTKSPDGLAPLEENLMGFHVFRDKVFDGSRSRSRKFELNRIRHLNPKIMSPEHLVLKKTIRNLLNGVSDSRWERFMQSPKEEPWFTDFETLVRKNDYALVLTVSSLIQSQVDALRMAKVGLFKERHIAWIAYFVDPFATYIRHLNHPRFESFLSFETEVYHWADAVFVSPEMKEDNRQYPMGQYNQKTYPIQFASMKPLLKTSPLDYLITSKTNVVFTGSFFDYTVRHPDTFFQLVDQSPEDINYYFAVNLTNPTVEELKKQYLDPHPNVHWLGRRSLEECTALMQQADILVNVGNECTNQTPSKVFDYIGAHRPIISFYSTEQDTSKKYLKNYPYCLFIKNQIQAKEKDLEAFLSFIKASKSLVIDDALIDQRYASFQGSFLAQQFLSQVNQVLSRQSTVTDLPE